MTNHWFLAIGMIIVGVFALVFLSSWRGRRCFNWVINARRGLRLCVVCLRAIEEHWLFCPKCLSVTRRQCPRCKQTLNLQQPACHSCKRKIVPFVSQQADGVLAMRWSIFAHLWPRFSFPFESVICDLEKKTETVVDREDLIKLLAYCDAIPLEEAAREALRQLSCTPCDGSVALRLWVQYEELIGDGNELLQPNAMAYHDLKACVAQAREAGYVDRELAEQLGIEIADYFTQRVVG